MRKYVLCCLSLFYALIVVSPYVVHALGLDTALRLAAGEAGVQAVNSLAYRAGIEAGTREARERIVKRFDYDLLFGSKIRNDMDDFIIGRLEGAHFQHRVSQERADEILSQLRQTPKPIPDKPGWGTIALKTVAFLTAADLLYSGYEAYKSGKEVAMLSGYPAGVGEKVLSAGDWAVLPSLHYDLDKKRSDIWYRDAIVGVGYRDPVTITSAYPYRVNFTYDNGGGIIVTGYEQVLVRDGFIEASHHPPNGDSYYIKYPVMEPVPDASTSRSIVTAPVSSVETVNVPYRVTPRTQPLPNVYPEETTLPETIEIAVPLPGYQPSPEEQKKMNPVINPTLPNPPSIPGTKPNPEPEPDPGTNPGTDPGTGPKPGEPGTEPGTKPGEPCEGPECEQCSEKLNFKPLLAAGDTFTRKFPFSLPWDLYRQIKVFDVEPKAPKIVIDYNFKIGGTDMNPKWELSLAWLDPLATWIRWILTIVVDIAYILILRRLLPE